MPAVDDEGRVAPRRRSAAGGVLDPERFQLRSRAVVVADQTQGRIGEGRPAGGGVHRGEVLGRLEERGPSGPHPARAAAETNRESRRTGASLAFPRAWRTPVRHQAVVAADEAMDVGSDLEQDSPSRNVERLLEAVDGAARASRPAGSPRGEIRVDRALRRPDDPDRASPDDVADGGASRSMKDQSIRVTACIRLVVGRPASCERHDPSGTFWPSPTDSIRSAADRVPPRSSLGTPTPASTGLRPRTNQSRCAGTSPIA